MVKYGEDEMRDDIVLLKVGMARQEEKTQAIQDRLDEIHDGVNELRAGNLDTIQKNSVFWRGMAFKVLMVLIGGSIGGAAVTGFVNAMDDKPPAQEQVVSPDKQLP